MDDPLIRLFVVAAVVGAALAIAALARRQDRRSHAQVDPSGLDMEPGLVVFTSTDCHRCKEALSRAKALGVPLREYTYELEAAVLERAGVTGVPLTLVVDGSGRVVRQFAGVPRRRALAAAVVRAGLRRG